MTRPNRQQCSVAVPVGPLGTWMTLQGTLYIGEPKVLWRPRQDWRAWPFGQAIHHGGPYKAISRIVQKDATSGFGERYFRGVSNLNSPVAGSLIKLSLRPLAHKILLCPVMCVPSTTFLCHTSNCKMQVYRFVQLMALQTLLNLRPDQILLHVFVQPTQLDPHSHSTQRHPAM